MNLRKFPKNREANKLVLLNREDFMYVFFIYFYEKKIFNFSKKNVEKWTSRLCNDDTIETITTLYFSRPSRRARRRGCA